MAARILVTGASGSGTTTLGRGLADALACQHFDLDDFFWLPGDPPFVTPRPPADRMALMQAMFLPRSAWVVSGSAMGWDETLAPRLTHAVLVRLEPKVRMARLHQREARRYRDPEGAQAIDPAAHRAFLDWAAGYDDPGFSGRNLAQHRAWLPALGVPFLECDAALSPTALVRTVCDWIASIPAKHDAGKA